MKSALLALTLAFPLAPLALSGCGAEEESIVDDLSTEVDDADAKADGVSAPIGTFRNATSQGDVALLVLKTDKSFHFEGQCPENTMCFYVPIYDGSYKFTRSGSYRYVVLNPGAANQTRLAYDLASSNLQLRRVGTNRWVRFSRPEQAWCAQPGDCKLQNLAVPRCPGEAVCQSNSCGYSCK